MDPNTKGWLFLGGLGALILANNPRVKTWLEEFNEGIFYPPVPRHESTCQGGASSTWPKVSPTCLQGM